MTREAGEDRGQRYEVRTCGHPHPYETVVGWSDDLAGAEKLAAWFRLSPGCTSTEIFDRQEDRIVIRQYTGNPP